MIQSGLKGVIFPTFPEIPVLKQVYRHMRQIYIVFSDKIFEQIPNTILKKNVFKEPGLSFGY